jgi:hypothetical protein
MYKTFIKIIFAAAVLCGIVYSVESSAYEAEPTCPTHPHGGKGGIGGAGGGSAGKEE